MQCTLLCDLLGSPRSDGKPATRYVFHCRMRTVKHPAFVIACNCRRCFLGAFCWMRKELNFHSSNAGLCLSPLARRQTCARRVLAPTRAPSSPWYTPSTYCQKRLTSSMLTLRRSTRLARHQVMKECRIGHGVAKNVAKKSNSKCKTPRHYCRGLN